MLTLFLASILYTSPQYFQEVSEDLQAAVEREEVTQVQAMLFLNGVWITI